MARHECCREIETVIFAARTNLPVLDFQTWQVCCAVTTATSRSVHALRCYNSIMFARPTGAGIVWSCSSYHLKKIL